MNWAGRTIPLAPDVTPLFFFLWGYVKDYAFRPKVGSVVQLRARINSAVASDIPDAEKHMA
jgi:hypothetical protein